MHLNDTSAQNTDQPPRKRKKKLKSRKKSWNQHWVLIQRQRFPCIVSILEMQKLCWLTYVICLKAKEDLTTEMILHRSNTKIWDNIVEKYAVRAFANLHVACSIPSPAVGSWSSWKIKRGSGAVYNFNETTSQQIFDETAVKPKCNIRFKTYWLNVGDCC